MAGSDLRDLTARLQRVRIRGEIVGDDQRELVGRQVEVVVAPVQVQRNIEASTTGRSTLSIETPFILSPLATSRLGTQRLSELGTKVLGPRSIDYWGCGGGFNCIQTLKIEHQGYISPRAYGRGFVRFRDFIVEEDVIVVRNQGTRSYAEWIWGIEVPQLPLFSLAFTEFWSGNYSFHTIWHKETTGWEERATTVVDQRTRRIVDFEVAPTIYYPARLGQGHMWHLYAP
jgi:hypothetical protein